PRCTYIITRVTRGRGRYRTSPGGDATRFDGNHVRGRWWLAHPHRRNRRASHAIMRPTCRAVRLGGPSGQPPRRPAATALRLAAHRPAVRSGPTHGHQLAPRGRPRTPLPPLLLSAHQPRPARRADRSLPPGADRRTPLGGGLPALAVRPG